MRIAVMGLGSIGRRHLANVRALWPQAHVIAARLHHRQAPAAETMAHADELVFGLEAVLAAKPEAAIVAGPASTHLETGLALAQAGAHVFMEKPLAHQSLGVERLLDETRRRGLVLMVGYNLRFHPGLIAMRRALNEGRIGKLLAMRAEVGQHLPTWRPGTDYRLGVSASAALGGGALLELSHELDLACWLGGGVEKVFASLAKLGGLEMDVEDTAELVLTLNGGVLAGLHLDMTSQPPRRSCTLLGRRGTLEWDAMTGCLHLFSADQGSWQTLWQDPSYDRNAMYVDELRHFMACIEAGSSPSPSGEDGLAVLRIVEAARLSASGGLEVAPA